MKRNYKGYRIGEHHQKAKLTDAQVAEIRALYKPHVLGYTRLAKRFGCGVSTIRDICTYRTRCC